MHCMVDVDDEGIEWKHGPPELPGLMAASIWMASKLLLQHISVSGLQVRQRAQDKLETYAKSPAKRATFSILNLATSGQKSHGE